MHHEGFRAGAHPVAHTVRERARRRVNERVRRKRESRERAGREEAGDSRREGGERTAKIREPS